MAHVMSLYLDDSGTRYPDHKPGKLPAHGRDWFALGGVLIRDDDQEIVRAAHAKFCAAWEFDGKTSPLHSAEIRAKTKNFTWLAGLSELELARFLRELEALVTVPQLTAIACVIDRPGYNSRYAGKYGTERWLLCKTAFSVVVERAAKYARRNNAKLNVYVEASDEKTDRIVRGYYNELRDVGQPFDPNTSSKYRPLAQQELRETLYDFKTKRKTSPLMQLADMCLWPICMGGYDAQNRTYRALLSAGILIDCRLGADEVGACGIKYSCLPPPPAPQNTKAQSG